jgi:hypothetical protein
MYSHHKTLVRNKNLGFAEKSRLLNLDSHDGHRVTFVTETNPELV